MGGGGGVTEYYALRNIESILTGEAKTYYKRKDIADPNVYRFCDNVKNYYSDSVTVSNLNKLRWSI